MKKLIKNFKGKKILITGHTGFKGSWLTTIFCLLGSNVYGISKNFPTNFYKSLNLKKVKKSIFDLSNYKKTKSKILSIKPDYIFHLAAQAIVSKSYTNPIETWNSNLISFLNILDSLRYLNKDCKVVMVTSDKCYLNKESKIGYKENDTLGGVENYSASKASCEILFKSYFESYFKNKKKIKIATARAGNVIGGGDWSKDRIVPDCIKSWSRNEAVKIRNPNSTRPWQHVFEPLSGYITLAIKLKENISLSGEAYNFGPPGNQNHTVDELIMEMNKFWEDIAWEYEVKKGKAFHEASLLLF